MIQINNQQADWISDVYIPYHKNDKLEIKEAVILDAKGKVMRKLKKKEITTRNNIDQGSFYEDNLVKEFKLKWNNYPYQIRYSYRLIRDEFLYVAHWYPTTHQVPVKEAILMVDIPADYAIKKQWSEGLNYSNEQRSDRYLHYWRIQDMQPIKKEALSPPLLDILPTVTVVPQQFQYGEKGDASTWQTYGQWHHQLYEDANDLPASEQEKVQKIISKASSTKEQVRALYHYLQDNTRYVNVAIDIGGLKPYPASYVCEKKYGDCKALTVYMQALLEAADIASYCTTVYAAEHPITINTALPSQQFNHVILCVPLESDTLWLENTTNYLPFDYLGTFTQNRPALLVHKDSSHLVKTPALTTNDVLQENRYQITVPKYGIGTATITQFIQGKLFEELQYAQFMLKESEQKELIETQIPFKTYELLDWSLEQKHRDHPTLKLEVELEHSDLLKKVADILTLKPIPLNLPKLEQPTARTQDLRLDYPISTSDYMVYNLPFMDNYAVNLPEKVEIISNFGKYILGYQYLPEKKQIEVLRYFDLYQGNYSLEEYADFYTFLQKVKTTEQQATILFKPI